MFANVQVYEQWRLNANIDNGTNDAEPLFIYIVRHLLNLLDMYFVNHYVIDWTKVKTQEDVITILKNLQLGFENPSEDLEKLCVLVNKQTGEKV